jgi:hypothetical protein
MAQMPGLGSTPRAAIVDDLIAWTRALPPPVEFHFLAGYAHVTADGPDGSNVLLKGEVEVLARGQRWLDRRFSRE